MCSAGLVRIETVERPEDIDRFLRFRCQIYRDDPQWIPPLWHREARQLDQVKNPFYHTAVRELFVAKIDDVTVGTVVAIDPRKTGDDGGRIGYFGHFETVENQRVAEALLEGAGRWLNRGGVAVMRGPYNGSPHQPFGVLVEGHDVRPAIWHGHTPPYYVDLLEAAGLDPLEHHDAFYWTYDQIDRDLGSLPAVLHLAAERARSRSNVTVRALDRKRWDEEMAVAHRLYVDSHATIPGHQGMSLETFRAAAAGLRDIIDPDLALVAEIDGQPVGIALTLPDLNQALQRTGGKISGFNLVKLLWYRRRVEAASFKLLGVLPSHRRRGIEALLITTTAETLVAKGYETCEASLVSSRNPGMASIAGKLGGRRRRRFRIYQKRLD